MGLLADKVKELSPYIRLLPGESVVGKYKGWREVPNRFDPEKTNFQYSIEVYGKVKFWESGNAKTALIFDSLKEGATVKITREGEGRDTKYTVESVEEE